MLVTRYLGMDIPQSASAGTDRPIRVRSTSLRAFPSISKPLDAPLMEPLRCGVKQPDSSHQISGIAGAGMRHGQKLDRSAQLEHGPPDLRYGVGRIGPGKFSRPSLHLGELFSTR